MNFVIGDATDQALCATLVHEFGRWRESFRELTLYSGEIKSGQADPFFRISNPHDLHISSGWLVLTRPAVAGFNPAGDTDRYRGFRLPNGSPSGI